MIALYLGGGILLLWLGGEAFVRGSVAVASHFGVSPLMIGLTLVGFGTSLPELVTSVTAALDGSPGLAVGNVVGSNIANVLLILGIAAAIRPVACNPEAFKRDALAIALATALGTALIVYGFIGRGFGLALLAALAVYIGIVFRHERGRHGPAGEVLEHEAEALASEVESVPLTSALVVGGILGVIAGAWLMVAGAIELAGRWNVSQTYIGLSIVAIGTSLPELVISGVAAFRGRSDVALGNIMGSNMFNLLAILGVTAMVTAIDVPQELRLFDVMTMVGATALLILTAAMKMHITRLEGGLFVLAYFAYLVLRSGIAT